MTCPNYMLINFNPEYGTKRGEPPLTELFVKLLNKGLKPHEHNRFSFKTHENATVRELMEDLHESYQDRFEVYLDEQNNTALRREAIVLVNGQNMVAHQGYDTKLNDGDVVVFMIAAVGGA
jgi:molybdopterin converting factor small subunit